MFSTSFIAPASVIPPIVYEAEIPVDSWSDKDAPDSNSSSW